MIQEKYDAWSLVLGFFDGDAAKAELWFATKNPLLGDLSPDKMIEAGRYDRLLRFVCQQPAENGPIKK